MHMSQWKSILVVALFLVGLMPTATSQASVAYSVSFTDGQVNIDIEKDDYFLSNISISEDNESIIEFDQSRIDEGDDRYPVELYSEKFISEKVLVLTVYVSWSIENWTNTDNFTVEFGELVESTSEQNGTMELTWYGHENLTDRLSNPEHKAYGRAENESDFKSLFFAPDFSTAIFFELAENEDDEGDDWYSLVRISVETKVITWELEDITSAFGCTEMVISNEGQSSIDVDVEFSGGGLTFSPSVVSVTLAPGGSVTVPVCVTAVMQTSYKTVQVSAIAQGRETNTQTNQVNKNAGFVVNIAPYYAYSVSSSPSHDICNTTEITFTAINNGNYQDTVQVRISNLQELEAAGFVIALAAQQYLIDPWGEQPVRITVNSTGVEDTKADYPLTLNVSTTLQGEDESAESTTIMKFTDCQEEKETVDKDDSQKDKDNLTSSDEGGPYEGDDAGECSDEADNDRNGLFDCDDEGCSGSPACKASDPTEDSRLPSLSLLAVVTMLGIVSILRRR
jgi:hypothetical protein